MNQVILVPAAPAQVAPVQVAPVQAVQVAQVVQARVPVHLRHRRHPPPRRLRQTEGNELNMK